MESKKDIIATQPPKSSWSALSDEDKISSIIAYATIFNDVIEKEEVLKRMGRANRQKSEEKIKQLLMHGDIIEANGFLAVKALRERIETKDKDYALTQGLIERRLRLIKFIGKLPLIEFIGISGSLAARNPVSTPNKKIDLDLFIITRNHSVWIVGFFSSLFNNIWRPADRLCMNHIWDGTDLEVYNKNFYVATEIYNLIPVSGKKNYERLLQANPWTSDFYPDLISSKRSPKAKQKMGIPLLNMFFYLVFNIFRCLKDRSIQPLKNISFTNDRSKGMNVKRRGAENGGYQQLIQKKFKDNLKLYFPSLDAEKLENALFPDELSQRIRTSDNFDFKYKLSDRNKMNWTLNYAKYAKET